MPRWVAEFVLAKKRPRRSGASGNVDAGVEFQAVSGSIKCSGVGFSPSPEGGDSLDLVAS